MKTKANWNIYLVKYLDTQVNIQILSSCAIFATTCYSHISRSNNTTYEASSTAICEW